MNTKEALDALEEALTASLNAELRKNAGERVIPFESFTVSLRLEPKGDGTHEEVRKLYGELTVGKKVTLHLVHPGSTATRHSLWIARFTALEILAKSLS